jgi:hypothetical protein
MSAKPREPYVKNGDDEVRNLREDQDQLPGQLAAQKRLVKYRNRVFPAFDSLDLGFDADAALEFVKPAAAAIGVPPENLGKLLGYVLSFGSVCVEAERIRVKEEADDHPG